ncbi:adenosine kinase isoform X2 [Lingula anatina]|nr:adenosine kinase isoform X2 [Lingula anatina]XP_013406808.1 adenosine kinase isoform X2 [Lingula anatina]|eukprot:XP_013406807.1 adenosine kinase isoform X2 [Lingula anatina]
MAADVPEGVLLGLGNPLLDMTVTADVEFLKKYDLEANNAIIAEEKHEGMFRELTEKYKPTYMPGGATQNSIRVAQWLLGKSNATTFMGCVGQDDLAEILRNKAAEVGVNVHYQVNKDYPTGVCASIITGENRSLVSSLGAANYLNVDFLDDPETWALVEKAQFYYIGGFVFPVCTEAIMKIAKHAAEKKKTLVMNLSAGFLCRYFADPDIDIMPYIDILIGNENEAERFTSRAGIETDDLKEMASKTVDLPKKNKDRKRIVLFTQGRDPMVAAAGGEVKEYPVTPVDPSIIKDTNGCGDAFMGGFLSQVVQGRPIEDCIRCGQYAAKTVIQHWGCNYPDTPDFK